MTDKKPEAISLASLKGMGALVDGAPIPREISFTMDNGEEHTCVIHVRRLSIGEVEKLVAVPNDDRSKAAVTISAAVTLGEGGKEAVSYVVAYQFHPALASAMIEAVNEVNGNGPKKS